MDLGLPPEQLDPAWDDAMIVLEGAYAAQMRLK
jgi:hypothetical protein